MAFYPQVLCTFGMKSMIDSSSDDNLNRLKSRLKDNTIRAVYGLEELKHEEDKHD